MTRGLSEVRWWKMSRKSTLVYCELKDARLERGRIKMIFDETTPTKSLVFGFFTLDPGAKPSLHYHEVEEVQYVLYGYGVLHDYEGKERPLRPGVAVYAPPGIEGAHSFENTGDIPLGVLFAFPAPKDPGFKRVEE